LCCRGAPPNDVTTTPQAAPTRASASSSPTLLSPFEDHQEVQAVRAYLAAEAEAINAGDLQLPALLARSTARRAAQHNKVYADELGAYFPGPRPVAVLGLNAVGETMRNVLVCWLEKGHALDRPGGTPTQPRTVVGGRFEVVSENGVWKVDRVLATDEVACDGVDLPEATT
jgi:hypothetical protein